MPFKNRKICVVLHLELNNKNEYINIAMTRILGKIMIHHQV